MKVHYGAAFGVGVLGAIAMSAVLWLCRLAGITEMNLLAMLGSAITGDVSTTAILIGLATHLVAGGVFGMIYAAIFSWLGRATAGEGALFGAVHAVGSGTLLLALPMIHRGVPGQPRLSEPGFMGAEYGWMSVLGFAALHILFGAMLGWLLPVRRHLPAKMRGRLAHA